MAVFKQVRHQAAAILVGTALLNVLATNAGAQQAAKLTVRQNKAFVVIGVGYQPLIQYRYDCVPYKPYIRELFTPGGVQVLRDAPADHWHHHGIMFAVGVNGVTFWSEVG